MGDFVSSFATRPNRQSFAYNLFTLSAKGNLNDVTFKPYMEEICVPGFRQNFLILGGLREMVFLRFYTGLTGLISIKLSKPGKVVEVNSVGWF